MVTSPLPAKSVPFPTPLMALLLDMFLNITRFLCRFSLFAVLFRGSLRSGQVREDRQRRGHVYDPSHRAICGCRVELRVGVPVWLHYVPGTVFRTDSEPFKVCG
ncbi:hypothetical protein BHM03_00058709 [Ensete ventricosum]|nr:hypothetical protein BHM03_00058709 [Ensete ventricosum]